MAKYYTGLFRASADQESGSIERSISNIVVGMLSELQSEKLEAEIRSAIKDLAAGRSPGWDGLPTKFHTKYCEILVPKLQKMYEMARANGALPQTTREAVIGQSPRLGRTTTD